MKAAIGLVVVVLATGSCAKGTESVDPLEPPPRVELLSVGPEVVLQGSRLLAQGRNFVESAQHALHLVGSTGGGEVDLTLPLTTITVERADLPPESGLFDLLGEGTFTGTAEVVSANAAGSSTSEPLPLTLRTIRYLTPKLAAAGSGVVYLNSRVAVEGDGLLMGGAEGRTQAELKGCFLPVEATAPCATAGKQITARVVVQAASETDRRRGYFEFSPSIVGLHPGKLEGTVALINTHADGKTRSSTGLAATFQLDRTRIDRFDQQGVSMGQFLDIRGAGFVGGHVGTPEASKGSTFIHFEGTFTPKGGKAQQLQFDAVPAYDSGSLVRYVLEEGQGVGAVLDLRSASGVLAGTWSPVVYWDKEQEAGLPATLTVKVQYIRQVVWVRYTKEWSQSLKLFGLNGGDQLIRQRILEVMKRDYAGINVEFRDVEPTDFKLYSKLDVAGEDPNGLGLLGYDNTPGKDVDNKRLYDWLGGVNALTQQDGQPGYGGVFLESMLGFSDHPPAGVTRSPLHSPLFDQIFDPFRSDRGSPLTTTEALDAPEVDTRQECPATDRSTQAACAMRVLANIVGSTITHELGHSLGLANPNGSPTDYHNPGDLPNRLMESGGDRPLEERGELGEQGPAVFCDEEYAYLKKILPLDPPADPPVDRPPCD